MSDGPIDAEEAYNNSKRFWPLHKGPRKLRRLFGWIYLSEMRIGIVLFIFCAVTVTAFNFLYGIDVKDIIIEANGLVLDLVLFGCLIAWFNERRAFKDQIRSYQDSLDDLSSWAAEEGVLKKVGIIKRLQDIAGFESIRNLDYSQLPHANFQGITLKGVNFTFSNLSSAFLNGTDLKDASLAGADLTNACLNSARLGHADLRGADLRGADFEFADLTGAILGEYTTGHLSSQGPSTYLTDLRGAVSLTPDQLMTTIGWENALRDEKLGCGKPIPTIVSTERS